MKLTKQKWKVTERLRANELFNAINTLEGWDLQNLVNILLPLPVTSRRRNSNKLIYVARMDSSEIVLHSDSTTRGLVEIINITFFTFCVHFDFFFILPFFLIRSQEVKDASSHRSCLAGSVVWLPPPNVSPNATEERKRLEIMWNCVGGGEEEKNENLLIFFACVFHFRFSPFVVRSPFLLHSHSERFTWREIFAYSVGRYF